MGEKLSQELVQKFKCVNGHTWESKDTGICPECYTNLYELKDITDMRQTNTFYHLLGEVELLKKKFNLSNFDVINAIEEEI